MRAWISDDIRQSLLELYRFIIIYVYCIIAIIVIDKTAEDGWGRRKINIKTVLRANFTRRQYYITMLYSIWYLYDMARG